MTHYTLLGHDNASLSMLLESMHAIHADHFNASIVSIMKEHLDEEKVPFRIEGTKCIELFHAEWMPSIDSPILLGSMVAKVKMKVFKFFQEEYGLEHQSYSQLLHPSAIVASTSKLGHGTSLGPGSILAPFSSLGNQASINRQATIGHHSTINDFATVNPGVNIAGYCEIGEGATIGMGANIIDGRRIGKNATVGAGSLVTKDIPDNVVAYGVPAKVIRDKE